MGVMRPPARTALLVQFPVVSLTCACPETNCVTDGQTAVMGGTSLRSCVVWNNPAHRLLPHVNPQSFSVEMDSASTWPGDVTIRQTALMAATRTTVVSDVMQLDELGKM